ncbi:MAG: DEDD exonuclease domain-containing protein [Luteococcus sp.]|uniref:DEDD exonuclease domain-containing protein n=1 Tax=Luteococcus sp. TaxID=1969402 RepID=UPI002648FDFF|nr:DEDD exonuclease domain-containing protein [Luteococcus sp.]MDN5564730.1 DEDD exonuclease domain-containing protein [Luteococcus sp.]
MTDAAYRASQPSFEDLGTPLPEVTFVVVDLETTGSGADSAITEIGAVKVRGGRILGEFQTLVNPGGHIPAMVAVLTGITDSMVLHQPRIGQVLPSFLEFSRGSVLVAHNAGFDIGFLKRACVDHDVDWPGNAVVDTVALARQVLLRDEVPNCKLGTLAALFRAATTPDHRALSDARATVDVLHGLLERIGNLGVDSLEDLLEFTRRVSPQRRAKRVWAKDLPTSPGVYCFYADHMHDDGTTRREVLYVGKSKNIRTRVRTYFTASEKRGRMEEMVRVATGVEAHVCATPLEAEVRELRLIRSHAPRYNRRSRNQDRLLWVKLTQEAFPRLSVVRAVADDGCQYWGPFRNRQAADEAMLALYDAFPIRQCTKRLSARKPSQACALAEMSRCTAPCQLGEAAQAYPELVEQVRQALTHDVRPVLGRVGRRMGRLVTQERFEEAAVLSTRLEGYTRATVRGQRLGSVARCPQIVAALRADDGGWMIHVIRYGRLAAAAHSTPGEVPQRIARETVALAETVVPTRPGMPAATIEECELLASWLETPGVRLMEVDGEWSWPIHVGISLSQTQGEGGVQVV